MDYGHIELLKRGRRVKCGRVGEEEGKKEGDQKTRRRWMRRVLQLSVIGINDDDNVC